MRNIFEKTARKHKNITDSGGKYDCGGSAFSGGDGGGGLSSMNGGKYEFIS